MAGGRADARYLRTRGFELNNVIAKVKEAMAAIVSVNDDMLKTDEKIFSGRIVGRIVVKT